MEIAVTKKQKLGEGAIVEIVIDKTYSWNSISKGDYFKNGVIAEERFLFSRKFTNTVNESGNGVFDFNKGSIDFIRANGACVTVEYSTVDFDKLSANEILAIIVKRINSVNDAFAKKYPSIDEIAVVELPTY